MGVSCDKIHITQFWIVLVIMSDLEDALKLYTKLNRLEINSNHKIIKIFAQFQQIFGKKIFSRLVFN